MSDRLHLIEQLRAATGQPAMAGMLLRLPDALVLEHQIEILRACREQRFSAGAQFVDIRVAALCALRDRVGRLPDREAGTLEQWRAAFAALAQRSI